MCFGQDVQHHQIAMEKLTSHFNLVLQCNTLYVAKCCQQSSSQCAMKRRCPFSQDCLRDHLISRLKFMLQTVALPTWSCYIQIPFGNGFFYCHCIRFCRKFLWSLCCRTIENIFQRESSDFTMWNFKKRKRKC